MFVRKFSIVSLSIFVAVLSACLPIDCGFPAAHAFGGKKSKQYQWISYKYPVVRWKQHPVTIMPGVTGQLCTTFDDKEDVLERGILRYTLRVSQQPSTSLGVQLLDAEGFKLTEFAIDKDKFHPVPGSLEYEAADEANCKRLEYKRARDYVLKQSSE